MAPSFPLQEKNLLNSAEPSSDTKEDAFFRARVRPKRVRMPDFRAKMLTLSSGASAYENLASRGNSTKDMSHPQEAQGHVLLGVAALYNVDTLEAALPHRILLQSDTNVYILECPQCESILGEQPQFPSHWQKITLEQLQILLGQEKNLALWWYKQNMHFFPDFWGEILGLVLASQLHKNIPPCGSIHQIEQGNVVTKQSFREAVLIGCDENQLLAQELATACTQLGYEVFFVGKGRGKTLSQILEQCTAQNTSIKLFFSLNVQGLDVHGYDFSLLQALCIPVALWFVDTPWHVLAVLRLPWWKKTNIFVTDASFIPFLQREGAEKAYHLPLAAAQHMWQENTQEQKRNATAVQIAQESACIFVGRAAFPQKKTFFAAARVPELWLQEAKELIDRPATARMPDFHWWAHKNGLATFWPESAVRCVGLGAEESAQYQRVAWLKALMQQTEGKAAVFGDAPAWQALLPYAAKEIFHPALDYYTELPSVYGAAPAVLNVTSLLLPQGLTQRHFDVWAAGGFLWTNKTQGLSIFPKALVDPIVISHARHIASAIKKISSPAMEELKIGWQEHIRAEHSYEKRILFVLDCVL